MGGLRRSGPAPQGQALPRPGAAAERGRGDAVRPRARRGGLVVRDLPGETVVYDRDSHQAHCLNRTAALVFRNADGRRTVGDLARLLAAATGARVDHDVVRATLDRLREASLLETGADDPGPAVVAPAGTAPADGSRREMLRRVGLGAAALLPVVTSILVPTPAEAANTCVQVENCPGATDQPCYNIDPAECPSCRCIGTAACSCG